MSNESPQYDQVALQRADHQYQNESKSTGIAFALWFFLGILGGHRYYMGHPGVGIGMLLTIGGLGIWTLVDGFLLPRNIIRINEATRMRIYSKNGLPA